MLLGAMVNEWMKVRTRWISIASCLCSLVLLLLAAKALQDIIPFLPELSEPSQTNSTAADAQGAFGRLAASMQGVFVVVIFPLLMVIIGGDSWSSEFNNRTIKATLLRPVGRPIYMLAKWLTLILLSVGLLAIAYGSGFLLQSSHGLHDWDLPVPLAVGTVPLWLFLLFKFLLHIIVIMFTASFILFMSFFIRSNAIAMATMMVAFLFGKTLLLLQTSLPPLEYLFLNHLDLPGMASSSAYAPSDLWRSIGILALTGSCMYAAVNTIFRYQDINR
ncbi:ABC transporter permease [Paenibacillus albicereus]|nr:ABC transporter permease subunit [Paenibacillus albicereus]